jgi:FkbM family methyltransferase
MKDNQRIVIEVGANHGSDTIDFLKYENNIVYAFEPTVELQLELQQKFKGYDNFHLIPMAVDITNGFKWFNIAGQDGCDWGCSSLHEFSSDIGQTWGDRWDFKFTDRYKVMTIRLDTFLNLYNIDKIDYLWIDAQGNDFNVLQSLGDKLNVVREGKCEAALGVKLYDNIDNHVENVKPWLESNLFNVRVNPIGHGQEADLHFEKRQ